MSDRSASAAIADADDTAVVADLLSRRDAKSRATRRRLLDATVEALVEVGYAGTSTQEVCRRAGASRGTLLHHYPTRTELVVAALDHVFAERVAEFRESFDGAALGGDRVGRVVDRLWAIVTGPTFYAWLELAVASRTDETLGVELARVVGALDARVRALFAELFPEMAGTSPVDGLGDLGALAPAFAFAVLNGLAIDQIYKPSDQVASVVEALKALGRVVDAASARAR